VNATHPPNLQEAKGRERYKKFSARRPTKKGGDKKMEKEEIEEDLEVLWNRLYFNHIDIGKKDLRRVVETMHSVESKDTDPSAFSLEELVDKLCELSRNWRRKPIDDVAIDDRLREEIRSETKYLPCFVYDMLSSWDKAVDFSNVKSKAELKGALAEAIEKETAESKQYGDIDIYERLSEIFGSETLAKAVGTHGDNIVTVSVERIPKVNKAFLVIDEHCDIDATLL